MSKLLFLGEKIFSSIRRHYIDNFQLSVSVASLSQLLTADTITLKVVKKPKQTN